MKLCALVKPIHYKLFLGLYNDMRDLSGCLQVFKSWQLTKEGRTAAQCGLVLPCNPCLTPCQLAEVVSQECTKVLHFVLVQMRELVTDMIFVEKVPPVLTHVLFEGGYQFLVCHHFPCNFFIVNISFQIGFLKRGISVFFPSISVFLTVISQPSQVYSYYMSIHVQ